MYFFFIFLESQIAFYYSKKSDQKMTYWTSKFGSFWTRARTKLSQRNGPKIPLDGFGLHFRSWGDVFSSGDVLCPLGEGILKIAHSIFLW